MQDSIRTPGRLTIMLPVIPMPTAKSYMRPIDMFMDDKSGKELVHNIMVRKGNTYIKYPNGRLRPVAQAIFNKNLSRLKAHENSADIVRDMQVQLQLL